MIDSFVMNHDKLPISSEKNDKKIKRYCQMSKLQIAITLKLSVCVIF